MIKDNFKLSIYISALISLSLTPLLFTIASAEVEINTTLEDNLVILIDYSGSTLDFREYIRSNALYSIRNIEPESNASVVFYGGLINSSKLYFMGTTENRRILEDFVLNIRGKTGDAAYDNINEGFEEAKKLLYNSTGTKQVVLISDGNLKITDKLIKTVKELQNNNVTIQLYQVVTATEKIKHVRNSYKEFSDVINIKVIVINPDEKVRFIKIKAPMTATIAPVETLKSSQTATVIKPVSTQYEVEEEYLNEFSNNGETSSVNSIIYYDRKDSFLFKIPQYSSFSEVRFYSYCSQTCVIVPFDVTQRKFFDNQTLEDVFKSKNAIELVKSGKVTESAHTFSKGFDLCEYYGFDVLKEESVNLGGEVTSLALPESTKMTKKLKEVGIISKFSPTTFVVSASCTKVLNEEGEVFSKIVAGRKYIINLRNGFAYYGIVENFQNVNNEAIQKIYEAKNSMLVKAHSLEQSIVKPFTPFIKFLNNCLNNKCQGDISMYQTNMEIFDEKLALINNNYVMLSNKSYDIDVNLALSRFAEKSAEANIWVNNAIKEYNQLESQIPFSIFETISNFFMEPEINYIQARINKHYAEYYLDIAKEKQIAYKFNSAIKNSEDSIIQSKAGIKSVHIEKSKDRQFKNWVKISGAIIAIFLILVIIKKIKRDENK